MNTVTNYSKQILSYLKGDEQGVIAQVNERKANSAILGQLAALEAQIVDQEEVVRESEESLNQAKYPTAKITDNSYYLKNIRTAQENLNNANDTLTNTKESLAYFKALKEDYSKQVEAA